MNQMLVIGLLCAVAAGAQAEQLPNFMIGDFKMETSQGFTDFMYELGVNWFKRSIACTLYPKQQIRQTNNGEISLDTFTTFKSTYTKFKLNEPWQENTADGRTTTTVARVDGNKLIKVQTPDPKTGYHTTTEVREFVGDKMNLILTIKGKPDIKSVRVYKRVPQS